SARGSAARATTKARTTDLIAPLLAPRLLDGGFAFERLERPRPARRGAAARRPDCRQIVGDLGFDAELSGVARDLDPCCVEGDATDGRDASIARGHACRAAIGGVA